MKLPLFHLSSELSLFFFCSKMVLITPKKKRLLKKATASIIFGYPSILIFQDNIVSTAFDY